MFIVWLLFLEQTTEHNINLDFMTVEENIWLVESEYVSQFIFLCNLKPADFGKMLSVSRWVGSASRVLLDVNKGLAYFCVWEDLCGLPL